MIYLQLKSCFNVGGNQPNSANSKIDKKVFKYGHLKSGMLSLFQHSDSLHSLRIAR